MTIAGSSRTLLVLLIGSFASHTTADAATTRWIELPKVAAFSKSMRSFGYHGLVTDVECGVIGRRRIPAMRFTYERVEKPVTYRYAWSVAGEEEYKKRAKKAFKPGIKILSCHIGQFYYGTQNLQ